MTKIQEMKQNVKHYLIKEKDFNLLRRDIMGSIRRDLWKLTYLKAITRKERSYLEHEFDKIIYNIK